MSAQNNNSIHEVIQNIQRSKQSILVSSEDYSWRDKMIEDIRSQLISQPIFQSYDLPNLQKLTIDSNNGLDDDIYVGEPSSIKYSHRAVNR